ncbi:MAG TPA: hypothetical protein VIL49_09150, partial [Capillimicrobium sp.]
SGQAAPTQTRLPDGAVVELTGLAQEICRRYRGEFPDEEQRYGDAGMAWCEHDNRWILHWALEDLGGMGDLDRHLEWLADVLVQRDFPFDRLVRNLEIGADVAAEGGSDALAGRLRAAAGSLG